MNETLKTLLFRLFPPFIEKLLAYQLVSLLPVYVFDSLNFIYSLINNCINLLRFILFNIDDFVNLH